MVSLPEPVSPVIDTPSSTLEELIDAFPFPTIRPQQHQALATVAESFDTQTQFTILELPCGVGKSGVGMAAANRSNGAHYLTSQNILSKQLVDDFGADGLIQLRGKATYDCHTPRERKGHEEPVTVNCEIGALCNEDGKVCPGCTYRAAKNAYIARPTGVTNYSYYLSETMYAKELDPREYLILDEAHNVESEILAMVDIQITQHRSNEVDAGRIPFIGPDDSEKALSWLSDEFIPKARHKLFLLEAEVRSAKRRDATASDTTLKAIVGLTRLMVNVGTYLDSATRSDWLAWTNPDNNALQIKPLSAAGLANNFLFNGSPNILMMSGTILDFQTFQRSLGIASANTLALPSDFPRANRRILYWPVGNMSWKTIEKTLPLLAARCIAILDKFHDEKGIIHTHTYRIRDYLNAAFSDGPHARRILTHTSDPGSRERTIAKHTVSAERTILLSPSMTEGVNLKDDLSRIQIITKVPYPMLDTYNTMRMKRDPQWFQLQTAVKLQQATGRSNRSADDHCLTIITDSEFENFLKRNQRILSPWWVDSIEVRY